MKLGELIRPAKTIRAGGVEYPILSMTMRNGLVPQSEKFKKRVAGADLSQYKVVEDGQLVVGFPIDEAVLAFQRSIPAGIVSPAYAVWDVIDKTALDPLYLERFLRSPLAISYYMAKLQGSTARRRSLPNPVFLDMEVPLPPLDEQRRIAAILDKADELRAKRREALAHLDTLTQSIFHSMFSQFLVGTHSTVGGTGVVQLGRQRAPKYQSGKHTRPYMRVANVKLNELDLSDVLQMDFDQKDFKSYQLHYGDILLNEGQSTELVGRPAMWREEIADCCFQNTLVRYVADPRLIVPEFALGTFLYYFHRGEFAKISSKTSSIAHLGAARFARMPMPTPPLELQQTFATRAAAVERLKEMHRKHLAELDALFASLQHRAFKGEL